LAASNEVVYALAKKERSLNDWEFADLDQPAVWIDKQESNERA
jgi:hypothetical protein